MTTPRALLPLRRALRRHRRIIAAVLVGVAVLLGLQSIRGGQGVEVVTAARTLPAGQAVAAADLAVVVMPADLVPQGALLDPVPISGRLTTVAIPRGQVLTTSLLVAPGGLVASGRVALPIAIADSSPLHLLQVGDQVDLLGSSENGELAVLVSAVRVVALPEDSAGGLLGAQEHVILVDLDPGQVQTVSAAAAVSPLQFALR